MIHGSCLCGKVKFKITGTPFSLTYCHCTRCTKSSGLFSAVLVGSADDLHILQGENEIGKYKPEPPWKIERCFCKSCGSPLGDMNAGKIYVVAASALDDEPNIKPSAHNHVASKAHWYQIHDELTQFEGDYIPDKA